MSKLRFRLALLVIALLAAFSIPASAQTSGWLNAPPGRGMPACPVVGQWVLVYWGGATAPIISASSLCAEADLFWTNRAGRWLGFNSRAPQASDTWSAETGEAHFARGAPAPAVAAPPQPASLANYADAIAAYLSSGGDREPCLNSLLATWKTVDPQTEFPGQRCLSGDFNRDGHRDFVVALNLPPLQMGLDGEAVLAIFHSETSGYRTAYAVLGKEDNKINIDLPRVTLQLAEDINRDGVIEVFYTTTFCGAHTCYTTPQFLRWNGQTYSTLLGEDASMPYPDEIALEDRDGDGTKELVMHGGTIGSIGAGVQRESTWLYRWDGARYVRSETLFDPSPYLYFKVIDGDTALTGKRFDDAIALFRQAIDDLSLKDWNAELRRGQSSDRTELIPYARFHLALAYISGGRDRSLALGALNDAVTRHPGTRHGEIARIFRDAWSSGGTVQSACELATAYALSNLSQFEAIWDYGYANPQFKPEQVCPL